MKIHFYLFKQFCGETEKQESDSSKNITCKNFVY